jgi:hypothetical protein
MSAKYNFNPSSLSEQDRELFFGISIVGQGDRHLASKNTKIIGMSNNMVS